MLTVETSIYGPVVVLVQEQEAVGGAEGVTQGQGRCLSRATGPPWRPAAAYGCCPAPAPRDSGARAGRGCAPCSERTRCETASRCGAPAQTHTHALWVKNSSGE